MKNMVLIFAFLAFGFNEAEQSKEDIYGKWQFTKTSSWSGDLGDIPIVNWDENGHTITFDIDGV